MGRAKIRCAVIGGGVMGAAAAHALARRGAAVTVFEQFALGHDRGSSHGPTRLFRTAYFEHPDYVPILKRAAALWRELETASATPLLNQCGVFMAGPGDSALLRGTLQAAETHDLPIRRLTRAQAQQHFPWFSLGGEMEAIIEPEAGYLHASFACAALLHGARQFGAVIRDRTPVKAWREIGAEIELEMANVTARFDRLIITPGAYAGELLGDIGALVKPLRKSLFWTAPGDKRFTLTAGFLPFGIEEADGRFFYGFPAIDSDGVKLGEHTNVELPDGGLDDAARADRAREDIEVFLARRAPALGEKVTGQQSCLYEMSPDEHFIIDRHPECDGVCFAIGHSGHGFKFAPPIGQALADLVLTGETLPEFDFLKLARLTQA